MPSGTVKRFNEEKATASSNLTAVDGMSSSISVRWSARDCRPALGIADQRSGLGTLSDGQKVSFEVQTDRRTGKEGAANIRSE